MPRRQRRRNTGAFEAECDLGKLGYWTIQFNYEICPKDDYPILHTATVDLGPNGSEIDVLEHLDPMEQDEIKRLIQNERGGEREYERV